MSGTPGFGGSSTTMSTKLAAELIIPTSRASPSTRPPPAVATTIACPSEGWGEPVHRSRLPPRAVRHRRQEPALGLDPRDAATVAAFATELAAHGGNPEAVAEVCIDMSPAFIAGTADSLPKAQITFDKFHVVKLINEAVDEVRRAEQKSRTELSKSRYLWLKNPQNLSDRSEERRV